MISEAAKRAKLKYNQKVLQVKIELYPTDEDIKRKLAERSSAGEGKATYIKRLIRKDLNGE